MGWAMTPPGLSQQYPFLSATWDEKQRAYRRRTQYERSYTSTDYVEYADGGLRAAMTLVYCGSLATCVRAQA